MLMLALSAYLLILSDAQRAEGGIDIYSLHVKSQISFRFATTHVTSRVANRAAEAKEAIFLLQLPETAFISNFTMTVDGTTYVAKVKEKEEAKRIYERAKKRGQSAAHVTQKSRHGRIFKVAVNVEALEKVTFDLTYQEHLIRHFGVYQHVIYVDPGQVVPDFKVDVFIRESRNLTSLKVPKLRPLQDNLLNKVDAGQENPHVQIIRTGPNMAHISYDPSPEVQRRTGNEAGLTGRFTVQYDVARNLDGGELLVIDGYFVHFFAPKFPSDIIRSKDIVFVLDKSGSMSGRKIKQLKEAMQTILRQLQVGDFFNVITFDTRVQYLEHSTLVAVSSRNIERAKLFVANIIASGGTNINGALLAGVRLIKNFKKSTGNMARPSLIVFLTDGHPTIGVTNANQIAANIKEANTVNAALFSLGFGDNLNVKLNKLLALQNNGFYRKIYAEADAAIQLKDFYAEISTPLLSNVTFKYVDDSVDKDTLTKSDFNLFFNGSELVVAGKVKNYNEINNMVTEVTGVAETGKMVLDQRADLKDKTTPAGLAGLTERLWAYLTIKELLTKMEELADEQKKKQLKNRAIQLSLKYHFVTPVTSMVVVRPKKKKNEDTDKKDSPGNDKNPVTTPSTKRNAGSADLDPHFIVTIGKQSIPVCFDIMGKPGQVFRLLGDKNLSVDGLIISGDNSSTTTKHRETYFGQISMTCWVDKVVVTPTDIRLNYVSHPWRLSGSYGGTNVTVNVERKYSVTVTCGGVVVRVLVHKTQQAHFLGFYLLNTTGLSRKANGLIGQFNNMEASVKTDVNAVPFDANEELRVARADGKVSVVPVTAGRRFDLVMDTQILCWFVHNNGRGLLENVYTHYLVHESNLHELKHKEQRSNTLE